MASPPNVDHHPELLSLVLHSKTALESGEQLCSRANDLSNASAQSVVDVLALDAKVRWITDGVLEQLRLATSIAKSIEEKRARLNKQEWDAVRTKHTDALELVLESLGSQLVPPDFHEHSAASSLFGSQHSDEDEVPPSPPRSLSSTVRKEKTRPGRQAWKTTRDFVDDQGIEDVLEKMESERATLDDILSKTCRLPGNTEQCQQRHSRVAPRHPLTRSHGSAARQAGRNAMNRDTNELPAIMNELEDCLASITGNYELLMNSQEGAKRSLAHLHTILDDLDELGEIMTEMLQTQDAVEISCEEQLAGLQQLLLTVEHLHDRYVSYRTAFNKLMLEMARRRQYREAAENIVRGMMSQLAAMTEEESQVRDHFNLEYGGHLPEDICLCIADAPTRWEVVTWRGEEPEVLPEIEPDLIAQARERLSADGAETL
ncbi:autophagy protein Apg17-domain-containing protein [Roridomyces roridus]|uniref:Autophagy-related protein 17 n=1 Tax=Roridomyces roridus TaxID=1738132 RepID=A0AAD7CJ89_9AGAR|nr:autophagy protein Apg17-domain-containing protein [Roridomyces roridus]